MNLKKFWQLIISVPICTAFVGGAIPALAGVSPGDVTPMTEVTINKKIFAVTKVVIKASPRQVWQVLTDYENAPKVFVNLKENQILEDKGNTKIVRQIVRPSGLPTNFEYVLEVTERAPCQIEWHRLKGSFKEVDGSWKLEPIDGGRHTLVTYSTYINGGMFLPSSLVRCHMRQDMPEVMVALKNRAELTATEIARRPDSPTHLHSAN